MHQNEERTVAIADNFRVSFQEKCVMLDVDFPRLAFQLEIAADIPWVLD